MISPVDNPVEFVQQLCYHYKSAYLRALEAVEVSE